MSNSSEFRLDLGQGAVVRRMRPADLSAFQAYRSDPEVARYQGWDAMPEAEALGFLQHLAAMPLFEVGQWTQIGIAEDGLLVGDIGVRMEADLAEIGISLSRDVQGRGLAQKAVRATLAHLFDVTSIAGVIGIADGRNGPSLRLLERVGMVQTKVEEAIFRGEVCTEIWFEIRR